MSSPNTSVLATVSDKKLQHSTDGSTVDYYTAEVTSATDYYPFGMQMPGRKGSVTGSGTYTPATTTTNVIPGNVLADLVVSNRTGNTPALYEATNSITFDVNFASTTGDIFEAHILESSTTTGGNNGSGIWTNGEIGAGAYRYGFNGQEKSTEINDNLTTAEYWEYDSRIGRRWNIDPVTKDDESPYSTLGNSPIVMVDPNGADWYKDNKGENKGQVSWFEGSGKQKGYNHLGVTYDGYTNSNSGKQWMNGDANGKKTLWLDPVIITASRKSSLADKGLAWSNYDKGAFRKWDEGLSNYSRQRQNGSSKETAAGNFSSLGSTYERYYQAEQDYRQSQMIVFVDFPSLFIPIPKVGMLRWFGNATGRVFWSGGGVGGKAFASATEHALLSGSTTLEMTTAGKLIIKFTGDSKNFMTGKIWEYASRQFAKGAVGDVHMFMDLNKVNPNSFWFKQELPILTSKGLDIITHIK